MDETCDLLRSVVGHRQPPHAAALSATGSAGMEAAFVNTVHPGDVVVVAVNGLFGQRMVDVAARCGAEVVAVEHEWGQPVDVDRVLAAHPAPAIIAAVHAETSTGVRSDIAALGAGEGRRAAARRRRDLASAASSCAPTTGASTSATPARRSASASPPAWRRSPSTTAPSSAASRSRARGTSTSGMLGGYVGEAGVKGRAADLPPHRARRRWSPACTAASPASSRRASRPCGRATQEAGDALQDGLQEMGLELFAAEGSRLPELTTVKVPDGVDSAAVRKRAARPLRHRDRRRARARTPPRVWRIGLMGRNARPDAVVLVLAALKDVLDRA